MDRTKFACLCLLASAFVLAGLLIARLPHVIPVANAALLDDNDKSGFTLFTLPARSNAETLFVLDQPDERLLIYEIDPTVRPPNGAFNLRQQVDLTKFFTGSGTNPGGRQRPHP
jgi:hypothetical protein